MVVVMVLSTRHLATPNLQKEEVAVVLVAEGLVVLVL